MTIVTASVTILAQGVILCLLCAQFGDFSVFLGPREKTDKRRGNFRTTFLHMIHDGNDLSKLPSSIK